MKSGRPSHSSWLIQNCSFGDFTNFENLAPKDFLWAPSTPGPPKEPKIMAQYPKIESTGSIGSIMLAILEVQVWALTFFKGLWTKGPSFEGALQ